MTDINTNTPMEKLTIGEIFMKLGTQKNLKQVTGEV